jgi:3-oxoacyl-[acyl-carrier protein] reductase
MEKLLEGKVCIVTGASRGIGLSIVQSFSREGAKIYALSRTASPIESTWIACDVGDEKSVESAIGQILAAEKTIDILVNNAGITRDGLLMRMKTEDWESVLKTNLTSAFFLSRAVVRVMLKQREGCILNISSVVGIIGNAGQTNYAASKAGIIGFTKSLAREVASRNVRVNAIAPGYIATSMTDKIPEEYRNKLKDTIPLARVGDPAEVAEAALFLCSPMASYITGAVLNVDGGMGM